MWTRQKLKKAAQVSLRGNYLKSMVVGLLLLFAGGSTLFGFSNFYVDWDPYKGLLHLQGQFREPSAYITAIGLLILGAILIYAFYRIFIGFSIEIGSARYFLGLAKSDSAISQLGSAFFEGQYKNIVKVMFLRGLFIWLWSLLFIVPGIVKAYSYRFVPYILAQNPHLGYKEVLCLSRKMTKGYKADIFLLDLSFLHWILLGIITCVGSVFIIPYEQAVRAHLFVASSQHDDMHSRFGLPNSAAQVQSEVLVPNKSLAKRKLMKRQLPSRRPVRNRIFRKSRR